MGRPTLLTPELQWDVVSAIQDGNYAETACEAVGITPATFCNWMNWGAEGKEPYCSFFEAVTCARARAELDMLDVIKRGDEQGASFGKARGAAWILERTRPRKFAQRINVKIQDELERLLDVVSRVCSPEDYNRVLAELAAADSSEEIGSAEGAAGPSVH